MKLKFLRTNSQNEHFKPLVELLNKELAQRNGDLNDFYTTFNSIENLNQVLIVFQDEEPIACGAFKKKYYSCIELKRMFVKNEFRNQGIASKLIQELELWAQELNYSTAVLETGRNHADAVNFYKKNHYKVIPNYTPYVDVDNSICFEKELKSNL